METTQHTAPERNQLALGTLPYSHAAAIGEEGIFPEYFSRKMHVCKSAVSFPKGKFFV